MRRMLVSRISRRVLAEHHLALTQSFVEQERSPNGGGNVGIIFTGLIVKRSLDKFIRLLLSPDTMPERLRQGLALLGIDKTPEIIVDGQLDATFSYIREHLEYILLELLLNVSVVLPIGTPSVTQDFAVNQGHSHSDAEQAGIGSRSHSRDHFL